MYINVQGNSYILQLTVIFQTLSRYIIMYINTFHEKYCNLHIILIFQKIEKYVLIFSISIKNCCILLEIPISLLKYCISEVTRGFQKILNNLWMKFYVLQLILNLPKIFELTLGFTSFFQYSLIIRIFSIFSSPTAKFSDNLQIYYVLRKIFCSTVNLKF